MRKFLFIVALGMCLSIFSTTGYAQDSSKTKTMDEQADEVANAIIGQANKEWEAQTLKSEQAAEKAGDYKTALRAIRMLADAGNADAQFQLGVEYDSGDNYGIAQDHTEAAKWYRKAADQGLVAAQNNLGSMYLRGEGVSQDYSEALEWYRKAADKGLSKAQQNIGLMYFWGNGVQINYTAAAKWFLKAASQGDGKSSEMLGYLYLQGQGVRQSYQESMKWYRKAADQGEDVSRLLIGSTYPCAHCTSQGDDSSADSYKPSVEEQEQREEELDSIHREIHQQVEDADEQMQRDQQNYYDQQQRDLDQQQAESKAREEQAYQQEQLERARQDAEDNETSSSQSAPITYTTPNASSNDYGYNGYGTGAQGWDGRTYIPVDPALTPGLTPDGYAK